MPDTPLLPKSTTRSDDMPKLTRSELHPSTRALLEATERAQQLAYICCLVTVFVDLMGQNFSNPVIVPYAASLTPSATLQSAVISISPFGRIIGGLVMPILADTFSRKKVVWASMAGSCVAYTLSALASGWGGIGLLLLGRLVGGDAVCAPTTTWQVWVRASSAPHEVPPPPPPLHLSALGQASSARRRACFPPTSWSSRCRIWSCTGNGRPS